jgi:hypothetical protein
MRVAIFCLIAAVTLVHAAEQALERDVWGYFRLADRAPVAFANISELHLAGRGEYGAKASPPFYGMIRTAGKESATYVLNQPVINGLAIEFETQAVDGVSYEFVGVLTRADFAGEGIPIDEVMLRGTMRKLKNGRKMAAARLQFRFETGG